ncbi:MAG: tripartite tricarboxylate transporter TctB family protein [Acidobacteriota bacterium]
MEDLARSRIRAPQDFLAGGSLLTLSAFALFASRGLSLGRLGSVGAGMFPRTLAILLGLAGAVLVASSLVRKGEAHGRWTLRGPIFICLGVIGFALTIRMPGLAVAGPLVTIVGGAASPETRVKELLVFAVAITVFCIVLFRFILHLPIPVLRIPGVVVI